MESGGYFDIKCNGSFHSGYLQCLNGKCTAIQGPGYMRPSENLGFLTFSYVYL